MLKLFSWSRFEISCCRLSFNLCNKLWLLLICFAVRLKSFFYLLEVLQAARGLHAGCVHMIGLRVGFMFYFIYIFPNGKRFWMHRRFSRRSITNVYIKGNTKWLLKVKSFLLCWNTEYKSRVVEWGALTDEYWLHRSVEGQSDGVRWEGQC